MFLGVARSKVPPKQNQPVGQTRTTTKKQPLPVCVVDQNRLAARYLLEILAKNSAFHAVTLEEMMALKSSEAPVFIIDREGIDLPLSECLDVLRKRHPNAKFVILDEDQPLEETAGLLSLGVHGFVSYAKTDEQLSQAVARLAQGELWFASNVLEAYARRSIASLKTVNKSPTAQEISQRESQVIDLVKRRLSNKEIGEVLNIQESTVKFHLSNIFSKLQVKKRSDLHGKGQLSEVWRKLIAS
jgi:DNA-binding NarL/FixJ family response regulator